MIGKILIAILVLGALWAGYWLGTRSQEPATPTAKPSVEKPRPYTETSEYKAKLEALESQGRKDSRPASRERTPVRQSSARHVSPTVAGLEAQINEAFEASERFKIVSDSDLYSLQEKAREAERVQRLFVDVLRELEILMKTPLTQEEVRDLQAMERRLMQALSQ